MPIPQLQIKGAEPPKPLLLGTPEECAAPPKQAGGSFFRGLALILILAVVVAIPFGASVLVIATGVKSAKVFAESAIEDVEALDFEAAGSDLKQAAAKLQRARTALGVWKLLSPVPWIGAQVTAADHTMAAGIDASVALENALGLAGEIMALSGEAGAIGTAVGGVPVPPAKNLGDLSRDERRAILERLATAGETLDSIEVRLAAAEEELSKIPESGVSEALKSAIDPFVAKVREATDAFAVIRPLAKTLPAVAGYPTPKSYLFFLANNTELRPSAGFFGSFGILKMSDGEIASLVSSDVYVLDYAAQGKVARPAPEPFVRYLGITNQYLRDSNWSPDFAESAKTAMSIYAEESAVAGLPAEKVDGVIAITPDLAVDLLRIVGPITVREVTFRPDNLVEELEYQVEQVYLQTGTPFLERKGIMGDLMQELVRKLTALPSSRWGEVLAAVRKNVSRKQVLFYDDDPALQAAFEEQGWAGRVKPSDGGDYLMVVDANLGGLKTDSVLDRKISYSTEESGGRIEATVRVTYKNNGRFTAFTSRYRTYTRFYVPEGSELVSADGHLKDDKTKNPRYLPGTVDVTTDLGKTVFGMFTAIEPGEERTLMVRYRLPARIASSGGGEYRLLVQKQSGTKDYPLTLDLRFGNKVKRATPPESQEFWGDERYYYTTDLSEDRGFSVGF